MCTPTTWKLFNTHTHTHINFSSSFRLGSVVFVPSLFVLPILPACLLAACASGINEFFGDCKMSISFTVPIRRKVDFVWHTHTAYAERQRGRETESTIAINFVANSSNFCPAERRGDGGGEFFFLSCILH